MKTAPSHDANPLNRSQVIHEHSDWAWPIYPKRRPSSVRKSIEPKAISKSQRYSSHKSAERETSHKTRKSHSSELWQDKSNLLVVQDLKFMNAARTRI